MNTHKILFFDVDGPMVPARSAFMPGNGLFKFGWKFDQSAVGMINFLGWAIPELRIVLSSHRWGNRMRSPFPDHPDTNTRAFWDQLFLDNNLNVKFHEHWLSHRLIEDGVYQKRTKATEIQRWLIDHPEIKTWATIEDDLNGGDSVSAIDRTRFGLVGEDYNNGLTWRDFKALTHRFGMSSQEFDKKCKQYAELNTVKSVPIIELVEKCNDMYAQIMTTVGQAATR